MCLVLVTASPPSLSSDIIFLVPTCHTLRRDAWCVCVCVHIYMIHYLYALNIHFEDEQYLQSIMPLLFSVIIM